MMTPDQFAKNGLANFDGVAAAIGFSMWYFRALPSGG